MSKKCPRNVNNFRTDHLFWDVLGLLVLNGPLTSLKHPSEGYNVAEASLGRDWGDWLWLGVTWGDFGVTLRWLWGDWAVTSGDLAVTSGDFGVTSGWLGCDLAVTSGDLGATSGWPGFDLGLPWGDWAGTSCWLGGALGWRWLGGDLGWSWVDFGVTCRWLGADFGWRAAAVAISPERRPAGKGQRSLYVFCVEKIWKEL